MNTTFVAKKGWIVIDTSSASGGVHYQRTRIDEHSINNGEGLEARHETKKIVDHVAIVKDIDSLVHKTDYILRKYCARTAFGFFATENQLATIRQEIEALKKEADILNDTARRVGSARRAYIAIVPAFIDLATEDAAREISKTVRDTLGTIKEMLDMKDLKNFSNVWLRAKHLPTLATGVQADSIVFALEAAQCAAKALKNDAHAEVETSAIQAAIDLFSGEAGAVVGEAA